MQTRTWLWIALGVALVATISWFSFLAGSDRGDDRSSAPRHALDGGPPPDGPQPTSRTPSRRAPTWNPSLVRRRTQPRPRLSPGFQRGIALGLYGDHMGFTMRGGLREIKALGATHVSMVVAWEQYDVGAIEIVPKTKKSYRDDVLISLLRDAKSLGLEVFLFPIIRLKHRKDEDWRGTIKPSNLDRWWVSYTRFVLYYARLAQAEGVSIYSVGSELVSMEKLRPRWVELIRKVRAVFKGKLLYSANWDHYEPVSFWDKVDYIGVTGYYKLTDQTDPTPAAIEAAWRAIRAKLEAWRAKVNKPLIFTELGYHSRDGTNKHPWDYTTTAPIDLQEQYDCYDAFVRAWNGASSLGGVYFWIWWGPGGPNDGHYTPRGKPAVEVLRHFYGGIEPSKPGKPGGPGKSNGPGEPSGPLKSAPRE